MSLALAAFVSMVSGFIALSYEILWVRVYDFINEGAPAAFGYLLGAYLTGLGVGAFVARRYCTTQASTHPEQARQRLGLVLGAANLAAFCAVPAAATLVDLMGGQPAVTLIIFAVAAGLLGTAFPLIAHSAIAPDARVGRHVSYLYIANILGSTAGSLVTGFVLLDLLPLRDVSLGLALAGTWLAGGLLVRGGDRAHRRDSIILVGVASAFLFGTSAKIHDRLWERLQFNADLESGERFSRVIENRSGVITVTEDGTLYGGGSYDGTYNISPRPSEDSNRVGRAYAIAAFHPAPRDVLMIGLGTGSWAQVLAHYPGVERMTVVEINPGYVQMMASYPSVASALTNPKLEFVIDDGRRFMNSTDKRYDLIVQNTIVYWRSHATNLLSREYMELTRRHLKEGGVLFYNTTMSVAAQRTGATVFPYAWRYENMLIASESPIRIDLDRWRTMLGTWSIDDRPAIPAGIDPGEIDRIVDEKRWRGGPSWESRDEILARTQNVPLITDDNMVTEWVLHDTFPR